MIESTFRQPLRAQPRILFGMPRLRIAMQCRRPARY
jgi:hypothetical protein